jgi:hypothetical protein
LSGCVDNVLVIKRDGATRSLSSIQRVGDDIEPTILAFDKITGRSSRGPSKQAYEDAELQRRMLAVLDSSPKALSEVELHQQIEGRGKDKGRALRILMQERFVSRTGAGKKGDPYLYHRVRLDDAQNAPSHDSVNSPKNGDRWERESPQHLSPLLDPEMLIPIPDPYRDGKENRDCDRLKSEDGTTSSVRTSIGPSSSPVPILLPEGSKSSENDPSKQAETPDKHWSDSHSHRSGGNGAVRRRF